MAAVHEPRETSPLLSLLTSPYLSLALSLPVLLLITGGPKNLLAFFVELATSRRTWLVLAVGVLYLSLSGMPHVVATGSPPLALNPRTRRAEFIAPSAHAQHGLEGLFAGALHMLAAGCIVLVVGFLPDDAGAAEGGAADADAEAEADAEGRKHAPAAGPDVKEGEEKRHRRPSRDTVMLVAACLFAASIAALVAMFRRKNAWYQPIRYLFDDGGLG